MHLYVRIDACHLLTKKRKEHPPPGVDASTAEAAPVRGGRDEQGEARQANTTPNRGAHLELGRLWLNTWSQSDFLIAEMTWPTHLYRYLHISDNMSGNCSRCMNVIGVHLRSCVLGSKIDDLCGLAG